MSSSSSGSSIPGSSALFETARTFKSISSFLGYISGAVGLALGYLIVGPIRAFGSGLTISVEQFVGLPGIGGLIKALPGQSARILQAGGGATAGAVSSQGLVGFIVAFIIVMAVAYLTWIAFTSGPDVPFLSLLPIIGDDGDEE